MILPEPSQLLAINAQLSAAKEREAVYRKNILEDGQRQQSARFILNLKDVPREIKARWSECDFVRRPGWLESWSPAAHAASDPPWLPHAMQWHKALLSCPELSGQSEYLESFDFDELMEFLDNLSKLKLGQMSDRWNVQGWAVNAQIVTWACSEVFKDVQIYGFLVRNHGDPVKNIEIGPFWIGKFRFDFRVQQKSLLSAHPDLLMTPTITDTTRIPHQTLLPTSDLLSDLIRNHGPYNDNGFLLGIPVRLYYQGINGGRKLMKRHELRLRGNKVDIYHWPVEGLNQSAIRV